MLFVAEYVGRSLQRFTQGLSLLLAFQANGNAIRQTPRDRNSGPPRQWDRILLLRRRVINSSPERSINCGADKEQNEVNNRSIPKSSLHSYSRKIISTCFERVGPAQRGITREISRKSRFSHKSLACFRKNPDFSSPPPRNSFSRRRNRTFGKIGSNSFRLKSRHRSITISSVIYEPERAARGETSRARAHVKSIFCHTLTRCCPNPCGIYDETLNDRSLLLAFTNEQISSVLTDVSVVSFDCLRLSTTDMYLISPHATRHIHLIFDRAIRYVPRSFVAQHNVPAARKVAARNATRNVRETRGQVLEVLDFSTI